MKKFTLIKLLLLFLAFPMSVSIAQEVPKSLPQTDHPRLMLKSGGEEEIKTQIAKGGKWKSLHEAIIQESDEILNLELLERKQIGRRLLSVSREALRRIFYLSYAHRLTQDGKYAQRAEQEMLNIAQFSDWNPSHFLDVAEMTMGMAIGYDWLYDKLSQESKTSIRKAIVTLGIEPSYDEDYNWFLKASHNWNQVCNAGMVFGALAVYEDHPDLAQRTIQRAVESIPLAMEDYKPDGAYPEGYSYWDYGTTFNVLLLDALEKVYGTDFGLASSPGFMETAGFYMNMTGVTGMPYNWGDAGSGPGNLSPAMFWFAKKNENPSLLWVEKDYLNQMDVDRISRNRILPATMIWGGNLSLEDIPIPSEKFWMGQGPNPVALMRSSWTDPDGIYLGFKAGSASVNHGHMDIGSFVMEADGVRWAMDFGSQSYESLESKGFQIFGRTQDAERWTIFRLNNFVHNTLTVDGQLQLVKGYAQIDRFSDDEDFQYAISDIGSVYEGQLKSAIRGVGIMDQKFVLVQDELVGMDKPRMVRWNMLTPANVSLSGANSAILEKDGKKLLLKAEGPSPLKIETWTTDPGTDYDAPNPGTTRVGFEYELKAGETATFKVYLVPGETEDFELPMTPGLEEWGEESKE